ncbi:hypothetical protein ACSSNL_18430 [Thalassobius sp. S69A]|uniref:hypothetical protein n=1 Tax=unclassified Thalassovita TaxID=2619711 RepID=UPI003C7DFF83
MTDAADLKGLVDDALGLLVPYSQDALLPDQGATAPLESLLAQCQDYSQRILNAPPEPMRMIHHFACTGGTLMSRALASQPNTMVLSEVDPFSRWFRPPGQFAPTDLIFLSRLDRCPPDQKTITAMFLAALQELHNAMAQQARHVVIRDHTHSHFCDEAPEKRPLLGSVIQQGFETRQIITVRHPLDSYLSLRKMNSATGPVATLDGYAARYLMFLNSYPGVDLFRYEDFVIDPDGICQKMSDILELDFNPHWQDTLPIIHLSGDSGRKGVRISPRDRRPIDTRTQSELEKGSSCYEQLCTQLGYDPDPAASAYPAE